MPNMIPTLLLWSFLGAISAPTDSGAIVVDGARDDWADALVAYEEQALEVGTRVDGAYLYLCIATRDRSTARVLTARGLEVWFDGRGGKKKRVGLAWPLGMAGRADGEPMRDWDAGAMQQRVDAMLAEAALLTGKKDRTVMAVDALPGITLKGVVGPQGLVYELKIPLHPDAAHPYAVGPIKGEVLGIGLVAPKPARGARRGSGAGRGGGFSAGGPPAGGRRGGAGGFGSGGGRGGGRGGGPGGAGGPGAHAAPLNLWFTVPLSPNP